MLLEPLVQIIQAVCIIVTDFRNCCENNCETTRRHSNMKDRTSPRWSFVRSELREWKEEIVFCCMNMDGALFINVTPGLCWWVSPPDQFHIRGQWELRLSVFSSRWNCHCGMSLLPTLLKGHWTVYMVDLLSCFFLVHQFK